MKYFHWNASLSFGFLKSKRSIIKPNWGFEKQLHLYDAILNSSRNRAIFNSVPNKLPPTRILSQNRINIFPSTSLKQLSHQYNILIILLEMTTTIINFEVIDNRTTEFLIVITI
uniref:Protein phosphatase Slingshot homolog 1 (Trinotate prediction) n=1 Tax=Myxobolus squamalis TaxID=59785 RepID=A0A6B2FYK0_MYXSQ